MAQAHQRHAQKSAQFTAVALQLMVQKSICAWLVNAYAVNGSGTTWDPPPVVVDLGPIRAQEIINTICLMLPVAVSGRNRVSQCMVVELWNLRQHCRQIVVDKNNVNATSNKSSTKRFANLLLFFPPIPIKNSVFETNMSYHFLVNTSTPLAILCLCTTRRAFFVLT